MTSLIMEAMVTSYEVFIYLSFPYIRAHRDQQTFYTTLILPLKDKCILSKLSKRFCLKQGLILEFINQIFENSKKVLWENKYFSQYSMTTKSSSFPGRMIFNICQRWLNLLLIYRENQSAYSYWDISVATFLSFRKKDELRRYLIYSFLVLAVYPPAQKGSGVHNMSDKRFKINISIFFNYSVPKYNK